MHACRGNSARTGPPNLPGTSWFAPPTSERGAGASAGNTANPSESSPKTSINRIQKEHSAAQAHVSDRPTASHAPQQSQPTTDHDPKDLGTGSWEQDSDCKEAFGKNKQQCTAAEACVPAQDRCLPSGVIRYTYQQQGWAITLP